MRFAIISLVLMSCGMKTQPPAKSELLLDVENRVASARQWAPLCDGYVSKGECDQGDAMLFSGLLCLAGEAVGCETAKHSIGEDGRVWRSPKAVNNDTPNSSSRDMFVGAMAYTIATKDVATLDKISWYIKSTGRICPDATDGRCNMTTNMKDLLDQARAHNGLDTMQSRKGYSEALAVEANTAPEGYPLHLIASQLLILKRSGTWNPTLQFAAQTLAKRQSQNPFFEMIARGRTERFAQLMLDQIPKSQPARQNQWSIERKTSEEAWKSSMIWEFVFLSK